MSRARNLPRGIWILGFVSMLMDISSEMIHALLPAFLTLGLGVSVLNVGLIEGIAEATASVTKVFSGALSDRIRRRKVLAFAGYGLAALTKPVFPMASGLGWIVAARFVDRVGKGIRGAPRDAMVADLAPPEMRGAAFGLRQSLDTIGAVVGPLAAVALMAAFADDYRSVFWVAVVPAFLSAALILFALKEPAAAPPAPRANPLARASLARLGPAFAAVVAVATLFTLSRFSEAFLILRAQDLGVAPGFLPVVLVGMNLLYTASAYPAGALSDRIGRRGLLAGGLAVLVAADLALGLAPGLAGLAAGVGLWGLHMGLTQGIFAALVAETVPEDLRGTAFGVYNLVTGLGLLLASLLAGALWQGFGPEATFLAGAGLAAASALGLGWLSRARPGARSGSPPRR